MQYTLFPSFFALFIYGECVLTSYILKDIYIFLYIILYIYY